MNSFVEGFFLQASLIFALGAQNIFVLESGLKKRRELLVAGICALCDNLLIALGVLGAASIFVRVPFLKVGFGIIGVLFLAYYGLMKLLEGMRERAPEAVSTADDSAQGFKQVILLSIGFSLLNPHVYLDTVILIGGYAAKYAEVSERLEFGAGAGVFSTIWFFGLSIFASRMSRFLGRPRAMKWVSIISGCILLILAFKLGFEVWAWLIQGSV